LSVDLRGEDDDWLGTLDVYWFELNRVWCWQVTNSRRKLIQDGRDLQMAGEQSHEQAMKSPASVPPGGRGQAQKDDEQQRAHRRERVL
jgi:hypothetical protein